MIIKEFEKYKELPLELIVQLTTACNLRCTYCFQYKSKPKMMSVDMAKKCMDFIMSKDDGSMRIVNFYGGEPTLNLDAMEALVDRYIENRNRGNTTIVYFYINSNGLIMNDRFINIIKKVMTVSTFRYSLSINGSKESHDKSRRSVSGTGTFDLINENIKKLRKEIPNIDIEGHAVADREFIRNLKENVISMITNEVFDESTCEPMFYGTGEEYTKEDFETIVKVYRELIQEGYDYKKIYLMFDPFMEESSYQNITYGCPRVCVPGKQVLCVDTDGDFLPCDFYLHLTDYSKHLMGNIFGNYEDYNKYVEYYGKVKGDLMGRPKSCKSEYGTLCKEECSCSAECQVCNSIAELMTGERLVIPKGVCDRTKLMCEVFTKEKFIK